ncbi:MAG TPA: collagen-like protein [Phycisphaerae bacterium]|nr:collagen-like protein [Phycisphaerae bacterium]
MFTKRTLSMVLLSLCGAFVLMGQACPSDPGPTLPAGSPVPGPAGPAGLPGAPGSNASVTAGSGITVNNGEVALDVAFTDGLYWKLGGNTNIDAASDYFGTTDFRPLSLRTNAVERLRISESGDSVFSGLVDIQVNRTSAALETKQTGDAQAGVFTVDADPAVFTRAVIQAEIGNTMGEAMWLRTRLADHTTPVVKLHRHPTGTNNFIDGLTWDGINAAVRKFHVNGAGTFVAGSDFAEALPVAGDRKSFEPGDVVVFSAAAAGSVEKCRRPADTKLAGAYSTRPGVLGAEKHGETRIDPQDIPVAITGIVPTKVSCENGPIAPGDLLTTSTTPGHAMKAKSIRIGDAEVYPTGAILGKAIEGLDKGTGKIRVLITLK